MTARCEAFTTSLGTDHLSRCPYDALWDGLCYWCRKKRDGLVNAERRRGETEEDQLRRLANEWGLIPEWLLTPGTDLGKVLAAGRGNQPKLAIMVSRG